VQDVVNANINVAPRIIVLIDVNFLIIVFNLNVCIMNANQKTKALPSAQYLF
jgi:rRNA-processing protein FCF1